MPDRTCEDDAQALMNRFRRNSMGRTTCSEELLVDKTVDFTDS